MEYPEIKSIKTSVSYWYIILLIGLIYFAVGFMVIARPAEALITLATFLGFGFILAGIIEIVFSLANRKELHNWGWPLVLGILTILIGILFVSNPDFTIILMTLTMGFLVLFRSIAAIIFSLDLKHYGAKYWWVLVSLAVLGVFFSFALLMSHMLSGGMLIIWTGLSFISAGAYNLFLSLRLRKLKGISSRLSEELVARYRAIQHEIERELSNN
ncbi:HdeD family acid-resistance protein [Robiginitalea aurantiaca]|uniref:DUF308 domain-containing protein n=1 Tax=Robiginitalea aurantiaca TaxID=3056915 RepID=A0ABT7WDL8_9FLAO|nr:DUF308 domain-containing protein [Robiginitalea aurantiaca]MDM9631001.1 DUF308 domain-containing protein [Robiginitalea aurantiaca]